MPEPTSNSVGTFFDALTDDYSVAIKRCFPRYREMLWAVLDYLPRDFKPKSILELGCGTGNLSVLLCDHFPIAEIEVVDVSRESIDVCRQRLASNPRVRFQCEDFRQLPYPDEHFDLIVSSIAIHHLVAAEKRTLFENVHRWLKPNGVLTFADQCLGATTDLNTRHLANWKTISLAAGSTEEEWSMWMEHQSDHDHHDTLLDQMDWMREAGFQHVDCVWRYLLWSVVQGRKQASS